MKPCVDPITGLRMKPSALAVLNRLRKGPATTHDLGQSDVGGFRFGARILELRRLGFDIDEHKASRSSSDYELLAEPMPSPSPAHVPAGDVRHGAQGEPATSREEHETADMPALPQGVHPATRADLPVAEQSAALFDPTPYTERVAA